MLGCPACTGGVVGVDARVCLAESGPWSGTLATWLEGAGMKRALVVVVVLCVAGSEDEAACEPESFFELFELCDVEATCCGTVAAEVCSPFFAWPGGNNVEEAGCADGATGEGVAWPVAAA